MADIEVTRTHGRSPQQARELAQQLAEELRREYHLNYRWDGETLRFERSGVSGQVHVTPTQMQLSAKLGLMMKPFKGRIVREVEGYLDSRLA